MKILKSEKQINKELKDEIKVLARWSRELRNILKEPQGLYKIRMINHISRGCYEAHCRIHELNGYLALMPPLENENKTSCTA